MAYKNGTVYGKYIKIKSGGSGVKNAVNYIDDNDKISTPNKPQNPADLQPENVISDDTLESADEAISYIGNETKTLSPDDFQRLISGINCDSNHAAKDFSETEKRYYSNKTESGLKGDAKPIKAYHVILSYKGTDQSPDFIHALGVEFARRICGDEYQAFVGTHLNTDNNHNHILINAYALDGLHKFQDRLHLYRYFREVANELSLEYGLPIMVNEAQNKAPSYPWRNYLQTEEGKLWHETLCKDLDEILDRSFSYRDFLTGITELKEEKTDEYGNTVTAPKYEFIINANSISFVNEHLKYGKVRDRNIGDRYTRQGVESTIRERERKEKQEAVMQSIKTESAAKPSQTYPAIFIPLYDEYGRKRSFFKRLILLIRESIALSMDEYMLSQSVMKFTDKHAGEYGTDFHGNDVRLGENISLKSASKKLEFLDSIAVRCDKYHITDTKSLDILLRQDHLQASILKRELSALKDFQDNSEKIMDAIGFFETLADQMMEYDIPKDHYIYNLKPEKIRKNLAALDPMLPKQKSELYQTLHSNRYYMNRKFDEISRTEAADIIEAIRKGEKEKLPPYVSDKYAKAAADASLPPREKTALSLSSLTENEKQTITKYQKACVILSEYGLTSSERIAYFKQLVSSNKTRYEVVSKELDRYNAEIKDLFKLKIDTQKIMTVPFAYGPLYKGNIENFLASKHFIYATDDPMELIRDLTKRLNQIDVSMDSEILDATKLPIAEEYLLAHDINSIFPDITFDISSPQKLHNDLVGLRKSHTLQTRLSELLTNYHTVIDREQLVLIALPDGKQVYAKPSDITVKKDNNDTPEYRFADQPVTLVIRKGNEYEHQPSESENRIK